MTRTSRLQLHRAAWSQPWDERTECALVLVGTTDSEHFRGLGLFFPDHLSLTVAVRGRIRKEGIGG